MKNKLFALLVVSSVFALYGSTRVDMTLHPDSISILEEDPFSDAEVHGEVQINNDTLYAPVQIHYRGAYNLFSLIKLEYKQRNWKMKFQKDNKYRNRREWNYNYEPHLRQKLSYELLAAAGVAVPSARHVELYINNEQHGPYLEYEDPDNKDWLSDKFGNKTGDLFKAAYDKPDEQSYFALLTDLGDISSDYYMHYDKKTNNDNADSLDFSSLIQFIKMINHTPDAIFADSLRKCFEVESFLKYLVTMNFTVNWDSYPTRPKNFWLYNNLATNKWTFIPWDLDLSLQVKKTGDVVLDSDLDVFYQLDAYEPFKGQTNEGTERPLVRRMMKLGGFRDAYITEYRSALLTYLNIDSISLLIDSASTIVEAMLSDKDLDKFTAGVVLLREFVNARFESVATQLSVTRSSPRQAGPKGIGTPQQQNLSVRAAGLSTIVSFVNKQPGPVTLTVVDVHGRKIMEVHEPFLNAGTYCRTISTFMLSPGLYFLKAQKAGGREVVRVFIK